VENAVADGLVLGAAVVEQGGMAASVLKQCLGNGLGFAFDGSFSLEELFVERPSAFLLELNGEEGPGIPVGVITETPEITWGGERVTLRELEVPYDGALEEIFPMNVPTAREEVPVLSDPGMCHAAPKIGTAQPKVLIPVFPGTNCEYDSARACARAGLTPEILVLNNRTPQGVEDSVARFVRAARASQILFLPGGFSGGDEPDGSGKFITAFFRNPQVTEITMDLLKSRDGLMLGICNGFQALIKLGLVPWGEIRDTDAESPTLTYNTIGRHQSKIVRTRIASVRSPWLKRAAVGEIVSVPVSHGEGRFLCAPALLRELAANGQIAAQYVDSEGVPTMDVAFNPNGSVWAVEGLTSPDGRVFGKMGHAERFGEHLYGNVPGNYDLHLLDAAADYFKI